jgi:predicted transcriptional regulator
LNTNNILKLINKSPIIKYGILVVSVIVWIEFAWDVLETKINKLNSQIEASEKDIKKLNSKSLNLKNIEQRLKEIQDKKNLQTSFILSDGDPTVVASHLQDTILKKATENKLQVITYRVSNQKKWKNYTSVSTYFNFRGNLENITQFLKSIESDPRFYRIHLVDILPVKGNDPHIRFSIELEALCLKGEKK